MVASQTGQLSVIVQLLVAMVNKLEPDLVTTPHQKVMELIALGIHWKRDRVQKLHVKVSALYLLRLLYRVSYMSAHVLMNFLNKLGKRDKMQCLSSILSLFRSEFNKFNNTRARLLDSIYHMTLRLILNLISDVKMS